MAAAVVTPPGIQSLSIQKTPFRSISPLILRRSLPSIQCAVRFRPCIDIHKGKVKQIVGSTLQDLKGDDDGGFYDPVTNFESHKSAAEYATLYKQDGLTGGHVIMLGADPLSKAAALQTLHAYPGGLQVGGGINSDNCLSYIEEGASHVTLNTYTSPKSYSHSRFRVRADCSGECVSGSTGDDDHTQNDIRSSCAYGAGLSENDMKRPQVAVSWDDKEGVAEGHRLNDICNSCPDRVPFPADLKPSGNNVMEHFHKETIRPVGDPSGAVPDIQITYPVFVVDLLKRGRSCLEVAVALLRRGVTYLEAVVGILRRVMAFLEAVIVLLK